MTTTQNFASAPPQNAAISAHDEMLKNTTEALGIGRTTMQRLNQQEGDF
jgi:hypothetical protein